MNRTVRLDVTDGIARIRLNLPERGNPIGPSVTNDLIDVIDQVAGLQGLRAVLLTGEGDTFCVGGDIKESMSDVEQFAAGLDDSLGRLNVMVEQFTSLSVPVVCAVNGPVGGGGIGLALCADLVIASDTAKLRGGYTAIGLTPDLGTSLFLVQRAGLARARRILFLNEPIDAETCLSWGIFDEVHPADQLSERVEAVLEQLLAGASSAIGETKRLLNHAWSASLQAQLAAERDTMVRAAGQPEAKEGITAFLEKRRPLFNA